MNTLESFVEELTTNGTDESDQKKKVRCHSPLFLRYTSLVYLSIFEKEKHSIIKYLVIHAFD